MNKETFLCSTYFISFLSSMNIWFSWNRNIIYINILLSFILLFYFLKYKYLFSFTKKNILGSIVISVCFFYFCSYNNFLGFVGSISSMPQMISIICLKNKYKQKFLVKITHWFAILLTISLILYLLLFFIDLPNIGYVKINNENAAYLPYKNYIFLVCSDFYLNRFTGPFLEPGHLGMMIMFLAYANNFNFKNKNVLILLIVSLFTLSLASYVLLIIGFVLTQISNNKLSVKKIFIFTIAVVAIYNIGINYNNGNNLINEKIIERLEFDKEKGISGNNRVFGEIDSYYTYLLEHDKYFWTGYDSKTIQYLAETDSRGTGYVMHVVKYGFLGLIIAALFYIIYTMSFRNRKIAITYLIFVCFVFWQRSYPFWTSWIICFVWGLENITKYVENSKLKENQRLHFSKSKA